jgi:hypothetical protein
MNLNAENPNMHLGVALIINVLAGFDCLVLFKNVYSCV